MEDGTWYFNWWEDPSQSSFFAFAEAADATPCKGSCYECMASWHPIGPWSDGGCSTPAFADPPPQGTNRVSVGCQCASGVVDAASPDECPEDCTWGAVVLPFGAPMNLTMFIRYQDRWLREGGRWWFEERRLCVDWERHAPLGDEGWV